MTNDKRNCGNRGRSKDSGNSLFKKNRSKTCQVKILSIFAAEYRTKWWIPLNKINNWNGGETTTGDCYFNGYS